MAKAVRVRFRIGNQIGNANDVTRGAEMLANAVGDAGLQTALLSTRVRLRRLQSSLTTRVRATYMRAIQYAVRNMIGRESTAHGINIGFFQGMNEYEERAFGMVTSRGSQTPFSPYLMNQQMMGSVHWRGLSGRTFREKGHKRYFIRSGRLRNYLTRYSRQIVDRTGVVQVAIREGEKTVPYNPNRWEGRPGSVPVGDIRITLMPRIPMSSLPALQSGDVGDNDPDANFERQVLGSAPVSLQKLIGHPKVHRPLLQPVFAFYTRAYIPRQIARSINSALLQTREGL